MGRVWVGVLLAGSIWLQGLSAQETPSPTLSIALACRHLGPAETTAPLCLDGAQTIPLLFRNLSGQPCNLVKDDDGGPSPLSFRLDLDDGRSLLLARHRVVGSFSGPREYWSVASGETLVVLVRVGPRSFLDSLPGWTWDENQVKGHRALLIPIYEVALPPSADTAQGAMAQLRLKSRHIWTGHVEGKGIPVSFP